MKPIRVVVAEDRFLTRQGICRVLEENPSLLVVGQAESGELALTEVHNNKPDVLLLDINMPPGIDGIEVIKRLRAEGNQVPVIALTEDTRAIRRVERAGGNGYLAKDNVQMLSPTISCVVTTGTPIFISPKVTEAHARIQTRVDEAQLLDSEVDVWKLLAYKNEEIAQRLNKSDGTIRNVITNLYFKLDIPKSERVSQRIQAMELARDYGILEKPPIESTWNG